MMNKQLDTLHHALQDIAGYFRGCLENACPGSSAERKYILYVSAATEADSLIKEQDRRWNELRSCIMEMSTNGGTGSQQDVCRYLSHLMDVIEGSENTRG